MAGKRRQRRVRKRRGRTRLRLPFNGGLVRGRMHPSTTSASPWNSYTVTSILKPKTENNQKTVCLTKNSIMAVVQSELGLTVAVDMRLSRIDIWTPPAFQNSDNNCIVFSPCDWTTRSDCKSSSQLNWFEAWGTSVQPAHLHYVWPKSIANQVLRSSADLEVAKFDIITGQEYIMRVHLMWRLPTPNPLPDGECILLSMRESRRQRASTSTSLPSSESDLSVHENCRQRTDSDREFVDLAAVMKRAKVDAS